MRHRFRPHHAGRSESMPPLRPVLHKRFLLFFPRAFRPKQPPLQESRTAKPSQSQQHRSLHVALCPHSILYLSAPARRPRSAHRAQSEPIAQRAQNAPTARGAHIIHHTASDPTTSSRPPHGQFNRLHRRKPVQPSEAAGTHSPLAVRRGRPCSAPHLCIRLCPRGGGPSALPRDRPRRARNARRKPVPLVTSCCARPRAFAHGRARTDGRELRRPFSANKRPTGSPSQYRSREPAKRPHRPTH